MPTRGYRKGISDGKAPLTRQVYARFSEAEFDELARDAEARGITLSRLMRTIADAHLSGQRANLPHPRNSANAVIRELARIGNNLNQLTRQANTGMVTVSETALSQCLDAIHHAVRRI